MVVNAVLAIGLAPVIGYLAAATATTIAGWAMVLLLWFGSRHMGEAAEPDARLLKRVGLIAAASVGMGLVLLIAEYFLRPALSTAGIRYIALFGLVSIGAISYFTISQIIGAFRLSEIRAAVRR
jgi:putative peptidoglycan lipid II flippase